MGRQRTQQSQPPTEDSAALELVIAATIAQILAGAIAITTTPVVAIASLLKLIPSVGEIDDERGSVSQAAARLVVGEAKPVQSLQGPRRASQTANLSYSAHYAIEAAKRLASSVAGGDDIGKALAKERRYLAQHKDANRRREAGARMVEAAIDLHGTILGWRHGHPNEPRPTHEAADGKNWDANTIPVSTGALPGVLPGCTCVPTAPFDNAEVMR